MKEPTKKAIIPPPKIPSMPDSDLLKLLQSPTTQSTQEEALAKGIEKLCENKPEQVTTMSEFSTGQIPHMVVLYAVHDWLDKKGVQSQRKLIADKITVLNISHKRKGRKEIVDIIKGNLEKEEGGGMFDRLLKRKTQGMY